MKLLTALINQNPPNTITLGGTWQFKGETGLVPPVNATLLVNNVSTNCIVDAAIGTGDIDVVWSNGKVYDFVYAAESGGCVTFSTLSAGIGGYSVTLTNVTTNRNFIPKPTFYLADKTTYTEIGVSLILEYQGVPSSNSSATVTTLNQYLINLNSNNTITTPFTTISNYIREPQRLPTVFVGVAYSKTVNPSTPLTLSAHNLGGSVPRNIYNQTDLDISVYPTSTSPHVIELHTITAVVSPIPPAGSLYTWYENGVAITTASNSNTFSTYDVGTYTCKVNIPQSNCVAQNFITIT